MDPIQSGPTRDRMIRSGVLALLVPVCAAMFLFDGYVRYPRKNIAAVFQGVLAKEPPIPLPEIDPHLSAASTAQLPSDTTMDTLTAHLGAPSARDGEDLYYFGYGGYLRIRFDRRTLAEAEWRDGPLHTPIDLMFQKIIGFGLIPLAAILLAHLFRVLTTRVWLTEEGLTIAGKWLGHRKPPIRFEAMRGLRPGKHADAVLLDYEIDGKLHTAKLDSYHLKRQSEIVAAIAEKTGLPNPDETAKTDDA